eukprot:scaffold11622_cov140-Isochrysis_galbana.AAC.3
MVWWRAPGTLWLSGRWRASSRLWRRVRGRYAAEACARAALPFLRASVYTTAMFHDYDLFLSMV